MMRRTLFLLAALTAAAPAWAQSDADAVLDRVAETASALADATFLLTGRLIDADGTEIPLEIEVQTIPDRPAASAYILQPDALADNIIVLDGDAVYNYTFLTHQVTIFDANDPDALGGLVGGGDGDALDVTFDLEALFAGYEATLAGTTDTPEGVADVVRLDNVEDGARIARVEAVVPRSTSLPYALTLIGQDGAPLAELTFENLRTDVGLDPAQVTFLPEDAEIIDERASADP